MKKLITISLLMSSLAVSSHAQGTVIFATSAAAGTRVSTNSVVGGPSTGQAGFSANAPDYYYALFYSTSSTANVSGSAAAVVGTNGVYAFNGSGNWTFVAYGTNTATGGKFASEPGYQNSDGSTTIPTIGASSTAELVAIGWSASIGSTYQALQTYLANPSFIAYAGESAVASIVLGNAPGSGGSQTPVALFGSGSGQVPGLLLGQIAPVPEPGTMALAALSGASLLLFRRRK
jgi:hypothetical protein